jgi:hypothetical protein
VTAKLKQAPCTIQIGESFLCECGAECHATNNPYVAANWREPLHLTCASCKATVVLRNGSVRVVGGNGKRKRGAK